MADTWVINLLHYLDDDGEFAVKSGPARRLAEYMCSIVESVTSRPATYRDCLTDIPCRRRPGHTRCPAYLIAGYAEGDPTTIVWECPACGDNGCIRGWQETNWDKRDWMFP